jgi:hypothetical protein
MLATLRLRPADALARTAAFAPILRSSASPHHHRFNCFSTSSPTMAPNDPYTAKAMSDASPSEKCVWLCLPSMISSSVSSESLGDDAVPFVGQRTH